jgi:hypothetical protein
MGAPRLTRRAFLRLLLLAGIGGGLAFAERRTQPAGLRQFLTWLLRGWRRRVEPPATVALGASLSYDEALLRDALMALWDQAGMPDVAGKRVLVKPNLIEWIEGRPLVTAPEVVGAILDVLRARGAAEIVVGEGPGFRRDAGPVVEHSGLAAVLARRGIPFIDLNYDDPRPVPARDGWFPGQPRLWLPRHVVEADLIVSAAKLKTHPLGRRHPEPQEPVRGGPRDPLRMAQEHAARQRPHAQHPGPAPEHAPRRQRHRRHRGDGGGWAAVRDAGAPRGAARGG